MLLQKKPKWTQVQKSSLGRVLSLTGNLTVINYGYYLLPMSNLFLD